MEKYSCSYGGIKGNFVLLNIESQSVKYEVKQEIFGALCVVQNIIQRGNITKPSCFLQDELGKIEKGQVNLIDKNLCNWIRTIKGDTDNADYPALIFFDEIIPEYLKEYAFVKNLIIPEAELTDILQEGEAFKNQQVDFYCPQIKTVIEIDGASHTEASQQNKDKTRDDALEKENIEVIRIKTTDIRNRTDVLKEHMEHLKSKLKDSEEIQSYKKFLNLNMKDNRIYYDSVIRIEMLLLSCLKKGIISLDSDSINIKIENSDIDNLEYIVDLAYKDICKWLMAICKLLKLNVDFPKLVISKKIKKADITLDFSIKKKYTDKFKENEKYIYIRNDYYDDKDYYRVASSDTLQYQFVLEGKDNDLPAIKYLLSNIFGFDEFREGQLAIIVNVLERNDTIGILPTGTGKSLCYQFAAMLQPGVSVVVVPIISLMLDQKRSMDSCGISRTKFISSQMTGNEKDKVLNDFKEGHYQLIWISPERFQNEQFRESLDEINRKMNFSLAVIDEVHCLSEWGHDFRVSYLALVRTLRKYCPEACLLGLTATASQAVLEDLKSEFEVDGSGIKALSSMNRDELVFKRIIVPNKKNKIDTVLNILKSLDEIYDDDVTADKGKDTKCGLIFTPTVKGENGCETVLNQLAKDKRLKDKIATYHGKLNNQKREEIQKDYMNNKYSLITCTKAFGMGIDKSNIKYTIHYGLPQSIESFYQEAGRAGRDADKSKKSYCYILYSPENANASDIQKIFNAETDVEERKNICDKALKNDLNTIMFLWNVSKKSINEEFANIRNTLKLLYLGKYDINFRSAVQLQEYQNALYKLSILGVVESWTIEYYSLSNGVLNVKYNGCDEEHIEQSLLDYIHKYDVEFKLDGKSIRYKKYYEMMQTGEKKIAKLIKILISWSNANILNQRLQSTYNMMELCDENVSDDEFRNRIDYYFRYTESTIQLDNIVYHPQNHNQWFNMLYEMDENTMERSDRISVDKAKKLQASLQRYLESYRYNTGLNFLSGILRLYCNNYKNSEGEQRLRDCIESIKNTDEENQNKIIDETLDFAKVLDIDNKDLLSQLLIEYYPEKTRDIFNKLQDRYSISIELSNAVKKLQNMMEDGIRWTI